MPRCDAEDRSACCYRAGTGHRPSCYVLADHRRCTSPWRPSLQVVQCGDLGQQSLPQAPERVCGSESESG